VVKHGIAEHCGFWYRATSCTLCAHPETGTGTAADVEHQTTLLSVGMEGKHMAEQHKRACIYMPLPITSLSCSRVLPNHGTATDDKYITQNSF